MVTHDQEEALSVADRIVVMNHGVIEQVGTPMEVYREPATPFVADFVGRINVLPATLEAAGQLRLGSRTVRLPARGRHRRARCASTCGPKTCWRGRSPTATPTCSTPRSTRSSSSARTAWCACVSQRLGEHRLTVYLSLNFLAEQPARGRRAAAAAPAARAHAGVLMAVLAHEPAAGPPRGGERTTACALDRPHRAPARWRRWRWRCWRSWPRRWPRSCCKSLRGRRRAVRRPGQLHRLRADAGAAAVAVEQPVGLGAGHRDHGAAGLRLRLCADAQLHAASRALFRGITLMPLLAPSLLSAISLIYWFGNQGVLKALAAGARHRRDLRRAGHRAGRDASRCSRMR